MHWAGWLERAIVPLGGGDICGTDRGLGSPYMHQDRKAIARFEHLSVLWKQVAVLPAYLRSSFSDAEQAIRWQFRLLRHSDRAGMCALNLQHLDEQIGHERTIHTACLQPFMGDLNNRTYARFCCSNAVFGSKVDHMHISRKFLVCTYMLSSYTGIWEHKGNSSTLRVVGECSCRHRAQYIKVALTWATAETPVHMYPNTCIYSRVPVSQ